MKINENPTPTAIRGGGKLRGDLLLIGGLLVVALVGGLSILLFRSLTNGNGDTVTVDINGTTVATYSLHENRTEEIRTKGGEGVNVLVIKDGEAYVESASCPDGICAAHRPISYNGEQIICLPNRVVITVRKTVNDAPDINA